MATMLSHGVTLQEFPAKAMEAYGEVEFARLDRKMAMFRALSADDRETLPEFEKRLSKIAECIDINANLLAQMVNSAQEIRQPYQRTSHSSENDSTLDSGTNTAISSDTLVPAEQMELNRKQFLSREVRRGFVLLAKDWSPVGEQERNVCYNPIIQAVEEAYTEAARAARSLARSSFRVLVPGAGAGRLPWELVKRGFFVEGCEASFTALLVGNYALNNTSLEEKATIYPFVHDHCNVRSQSNATREVVFPDVNPKEIPYSTDFAMRAGSFEDAYDGQDNAWDVVASCMAFDLSETVIEHVKRVSQILKPGGVWTFVGPIPCLDGGRGEGIHLTVNEFMQILRKSGFKVTKQEKITCLHSTDPKSMRLVSFICPFVVAVKIRPAM